MGAELGRVLLGSPEAGQKDARRMLYAAFKEACCRLW